MNDMISTVELSAVSEGPKHILVQEPAITTEDAERAEVPRKMEKSHKKLAIILAIGTIIAILGITTGSLWPSIYDWIMLKALILTPSSITYGMWKETPIPMYLKLYMFNLTNPDDLKNSTDVKPNFVEMGPYVFREIDYKVNKIWNKNGTITFQRKRVWWFDESLSNGSLSDKITNLNPITATVGFTLRDKPRLLRDLVNRVMLSLGEKLIITKNVSTLLFDGYNDTLLEIAQKLKAIKIPFDKFGWFYARNGSDDYDGTYNMLVGSSNLYDLGMLKEWNFNNRTDTYKGSCGIIKGSNGDLWPPLPDNKTVSIFIPDICTSLDLTYENTTTFLDVTGNKYVGDDRMLDNGTKVSSRQCYCSDQDCVPSGALNISTCKYGAPVFLSMPHYYLADPSYTDAITGMNPDKEKHEFSLIVEPRLGIPMQARAQMQINLLIQPVKYMSMFEDIKKAYVPMLWFTQEVDLTANYANTIKIALILPTLGAVTCFGIAGIGILVFFIGVFIFVRQKWRGEEGQTLISKHEGDITHSS